MWQHVVLGAACGVLVAAVCWDLLVRFGFLDNDETVDELTVKALPFFMILAYWAAEPVHTPVVPMPKRRPVPTPQRARRRH